MKIGKTKLSQKILVIASAILLLFNLIVPVAKATGVISAVTGAGTSGAISSASRKISNGATGEEDGGTLADPIMQFIRFLGDGAMNLMQRIFVGNDDAIDKEAAHVGLLGNSYIHIPNFQISPEKIFSGSVPAFDINFFTPGENYEYNFKDSRTINVLKNYVDLFEYKQNEVNDVTGSHYFFDYTTVLKEKEGVESVLNNLNNLNDSTLDAMVKDAIQSCKFTIYTDRDAGKMMADNLRIKCNEIIAYIEANDVKVETETTASILQSTISYWYNILRNISIVGLLSVLVYIGIRIVTASAASDKSKYKEMLKDWVVAICLLFFMHYLMNFIVTATGSISSALSSNSQNTNTTYIQADTGVAYTGDELLGDIRIRSEQEGKFSTRMAYTIVYAVIVVYTLIFSLMYLKRVIYMAFFTIMAPMVALTYPLDKIRDGKAQAFDMWMKEYTFNALIQPFHLLIYYVLVGSTMSLAVSNPLFALVAIGFMLPAEKLLRKFFGFNKSETSGMLGGMLSGALVMQGMNALTKQIGHSGGKGKAGIDGKPEKQNSKSIRTGKNINELMDGMPKDNSISNNNKTSKNNNGTTDNGKLNNRNNKNNEDEDNSLVGFGQTYDNEDLNTRPNVNNYQDDDNEELVGFGQIYDDDPYTGIDDEGNLIGINDDKVPTVNINDDVDDDENPGTDEYGDPVGFGKIYEDEKEKFWTDERIDKVFSGAKFITGRTLKYVGLPAAKLAAKAATAATMGTVGVVAGLASDDYSNVFKWGAAGVAGGNMLANAGINRVGRLPSDAYRVKAHLEKEREEWENQVLTKEERKEARNNRADAEFMRDRVAVARYKDEFKDKWQEAMKAAIAYREYGVTDNDTIIKAMKLKTKGLGDLADKKRILAAKTASQLNRKDVDSFGDRLRTNRFRASDVETMKQAIRDFNDWE